jgi:hypothetical protein
MLADMDGDADTLLLSEADTLELIDGLADTLELSDALIEADMDGLAETDDDREELTDGLIDDDWLEETLELILGLALTDDETLDD